MFYVTRSGAGSEDDMMCRCGNYVVCRIFCHFSHRINLVPWNEVAQWRRKSCRWNLIYCNMYLQWLSLTRFHLCSLGVLHLAISNFIHLWAEPNLSSQEKNKKKMLLSLVQVHYGIVCIYRWINQMCFKSKTTSKKKTK